MFTTLCTEPVISRWGRRKIVSEKVTYKRGEFYLSRVVSRKPDNKKYIEKFLKDCRVPVILSDSEQALKMKYRIMLNTVKRYAKPQTDIAVYDPSGKLSHIFEEAVRSFRTVYVVSEEKDYERYNEIVLSKFGTCAVLKERLSDINGCNYIVSSERLPFSAGPYVFGEHGWFVNNCKPVFACDFPSVLPDYADVFSVAAGIYEFLKDEKIAHAYCTQFSLKGVKAEAENFFK